MQKKKTNSCPLTPSEWIDFLNTETNTNYLVLYSEIQSTLTKIILLLTTLTVSLSTYSLLYNFLEIKYVLILSFIFSIIVIVTGIIIIWILETLKRIRNKKINPALDQLSQLMADILNGDLKDSNEIRARYAKITRNIK